MPKTRQPIRNSQKLALREQRRLRPSASNIELGEWFEKEYNQRISASSVSDILSGRFKHLEDGATPLQKESARARAPDWPELEDALNDWCTTIEGKVNISGALIRSQAEFFWSRLPAYRGKKAPSFSNSWLYGFQQRRGATGRKSHSELANDPAEAASCMETICDYLATKSVADIYACDETALFWKRRPEHSEIAQDSSPNENKHDPNKLTALLCCNADGSDKLPLWFVGTNGTPRAFSDANVDPENLGGPMPVRA